MTDVTETTFEHDVLERSAEKPVLVDFWADWCGPCKALTPVLEREVEASGGAVELAKVDVDANPELAARYGVRGIPAVKAFRNGHVVDEFVGALPPAAVQQFLERLSAPPAEERLAEELREDQPEVAEALAAGDVELALRLLVVAVGSADGDQRERIRAAMVDLFGDLGPDHPLTTAYRRRLATALY